MPLKTLLVNVDLLLYFLVQIFAACVRNKAVYSTLLMRELGPPKSYMLNNWTTHPAGQNAHRVNFSSF